MNEWNMFSEETIAGNSLAVFKRKLDRHLRDVRWQANSFLPFIVSE